MFILWFDKMAFDKMAFDKMTFDKMTFDKMTFDKMSWDHIFNFFHRLLKFYHYLSVALLKGY